MLEELQRRNFAATTIRTYLHGVTHFGRYFRRPPDQLGPEDIRKYQAMLFTKLKYSLNTVTLRLASLRFFYIHVLKRGWSIAETPYPKEVRHLPQVLSQEEVARLIDAADTPFHRVLLMALYATGARRAEAANLKVSDIDSQRMVVHIREGKDGRDRDVMLSPKLLEALRDYWRGLRRKPKSGSFPATAGTHQAVLSAPRCYGVPARLPPNAPALSRRTSIRTRYVTALPHTFSKPAPTCAPSRYCSDIATSKLRPSICICPNGISAQPPARSMHSPSRSKEDTSTVHEPASPGDGRHRPLCRTSICGTQPQVDQLATP
jgi:integrase